MKKLLVIFLLSVTSLFATIDLNKASIQQLQTLPGIGKVKAVAIDLYRKKHSFNSIKDITKVKGIGEKLFIKIKNKITVKTIKKDLKSKNILTTKIQKL